MLVQQGPGGEPVYFICILFDVLYFLRDQASVRCHPRPPLPPPQYLYTCQGRNRQVTHDQRLLHAQERRHRSSPETGLEDRAQPLAEILQQI